MACLTRSDLIKPLALRLLIRPALLRPELLHAIVGDVGPFWWVEKSLMGR